jgi:putative membrane protein
MAERLLVLAVDIDNDLYRKAKRTGPVIGKEANVKAATALALADPQDTDANTMFEAVHKYEELKKEGLDVEIATITGSEREGYSADAELSRQLDMLLDRLKVDACVLVTDGASDTRVLPILKTRIKVNSVDFVRMKQAEQFENAYFAVLEKLKEPHYARIVFGIPAVLLLLFAISYYLNYGWQLPVALIGLYLVIKGFGLEDALVSSFKGFGFSISRLSFLFYVSALLFFFIGLILGFGAFVHNPVSNQLSRDSYAVQGFLLVFPISIGLYLIGRIMDLENRHMRYRAINQGTYISYSIVSLAILYVLTEWFIGQIYFWQFLLWVAVLIVIGYGISILSGMVKRHAVEHSSLKNKSVINDIGAYIGKVTSIDPKRGVMSVRTDYGSTISLEIDRISTSETDRIIVR